MDWLDQHRARLSSVKALIFDWDGTLADSIDNIVRCMQKATVTTGLPMPGDQAVRDIIGLGLAEAVGELFPDVALDQRTATVEAYRHHYLSPEHRKVTLFSGVVELLENLENCGYMLAVATGKSRRGLDRALAETGLHGRFLATRTVDECHSKPHPQMLDEIADHMGVQRQEMLMIGDGVMDMQMAGNAGVMALGVSTGAADDDELLAEGAVSCLQSVSALAGLASERGVIR